MGHCKAPGAGRRHRHPGWCALSIGALATALVMLLMASGAGTASAQEEGATATTTAATNITATEATLNGIVNANGYTV